MNMEDLIALIYGHTSADTIEIPAKEVKELEINLEDQTWNYRRFERTPIGSMRRIDGQWTDGYKTGIIGVYDRTNPDHMKNMQADKKTATSPTDGGQDSGNW